MAKEPERPISVRLGERARAQLDDLRARMGGVTTTDAVRMAIDLAWGAWGRHEAIEAPPRARARRLIESEARGRLCVALIDAGPIHYITTTAGHVRVLIASRKGGEIHDLTEPAAEATGAHYVAPQGIEADRGVLHGELEAIAGRTLARRDLH